MTAGYLLVCNAAAGSAGEGAAEKARSVLADDGPVEVATTGSVDELDEVLARADGRVVVVLGGDGSLHAVVNRLRAADALDGTTLGVVPLGTGNDLARGLRVPLDPADAARVVVEGHIRNLDLFVDDTGEAVVNVSHCGLGAEAAETGSEWKGRLGRMAYPAGALVAALKEPGWRLRVEVDGNLIGPPDDRVLIVGVGNGRSIGGGTPLCPNADPGDGLLDVVVSRSTGPAARAAFAVDLRRGDHPDRADVDAVRGREVRISGESVRHNADGEISDELTDRIYRVEPAAWRLIAPAASMPA